jgi:hypothetical protein
LGESPFATPGPPSQTLTLATLPPVVLAHGQDCLTLVTAVGFPHCLRGRIDGLGVFTVHPT